MFIGHFALGFAARRAAPQVPLAILFLAVYRSAIALFAVVLVWSWWAEKA